MLFIKLSAIIAWQKERWRFDAQASFIFTCLTISIHLVLHEHIFFRFSSIMARTKAATKNERSK